MAAVRKAISKKMRFEVFKRDSFKCQYCGAAPPRVILHVDHINPVKDGGKNDIDNLVTACEPCNLGKGARQLSDVPQNLKDKAAVVKEREEQLRGYNEVMLQKAKRIDDDAWDVASAIEGFDGLDSFDKKDFLSIKLFLDRLPLFEVMRAAELAYTRVRSGKQRFKYFCGVCWKKIREAEGG